jgi:PAS domain S-box-containing protein
LPNEAKESATLRGSSLSADAAAQLVALIESTENLIFSVDLDYRLVTFNTAFARHIQLTWGVKAQAGMGLVDMLSPHEASVWSTMFARVVNEGSCRTEYPLRTGRWLELSFNNIIVDGGTAGISVFGTDITERKLADELRKASERRFRTLIEEGPSAIAIGRNGVNLYVNNKFLKMFRLESADEAIGQSLGEWWSTEWRPIIEERARQRMLGLPAPDEYEAIGRRADGAHFPVHISVARVELADGPATLAFLTDITERKVAEEALRSSEARFRSYFDLPLVGTSVTSPEKGFIAVNDRLCEILGYSRDELVQKNWVDLTHPDDLEADVDQFRRLLAGEVETYSLEKRFICKDGHAIWTAISVGCVRKTDGSVEYICGNMRDISERKRAEEALRASEARFRTLFEKAPTGIGFGRDGAILYVNPKYLEIYRLQSAEEVIGQSIVEQFVPEDRPFVAATLRQPVAEQEALTSFDVTGLRSDGSLFPLHVDATQVELSDGPAAFAFLTDMTESKAAEAALRASLEQTINVISETVEHRDPYTAGHQRRVADLCARIGKKLGLDPDRILGLRLAAAIHDLGKIGIPAEILAKPGQLTPIQLELIKEHAQLGCEIVRHVQFPWPIGEIIRQHHERLDGSGYPRGLRGDAILLEARILAVADVVEAMGSHRPYRPARGIDVALGEIADQRGAIYDTAVVDACISLFQIDGYVFPV